MTGIGDIVFLGTDFGNLSIAGGTTFTVRSKITIRGQLEAIICRAFSDRKNELGYQILSDWRKSSLRSSASAGRGESLVTRCWGRVPATRLSMSFLS